MRFIKLLFIAIIALAVFGRPVLAQDRTIEVHVTVQGHAAPASGASGDHMLTFSAPVEVPGVALAPGSYVFRFASDSRSVMQVLSADHSVSYAMFLVTPVWSSATTSNYVVTLHQSSGGAPPRMTSLFFPDASTGFEFTYPSAMTRGTGSGD